MKAMTIALRMALGQIQGKGDPTLLTGATGSGKSAVITECAKHQTVQRLLSERESEGKGSLIQSSIYVTDHDGIPDDCLIMMADVNRMTEADCGDDNNMLGELLYAAAKDYDRNANETLYQTKLSNALTYALKNPANDSLAYKLKDMNDENRKHITDILLRFPIPDIMGVYHEMRAKNTKKGQKGLRMFIELISAREQFKPLINAFWKSAIDYINSEVEELRRVLEDHGASIEDTSTYGFRFIAVMGEEDLADLDTNADISVVRMLLRSEDGTKEHLLSNVSLIYRGGDRIFEVEHKDTLAVSEVDGVKIHCVKFVDTQGLFHANGSQIRDESERMIDLLSAYHSNRLVLVINSEIYNTTKDGYEAVAAMLQEANRNIEIYPLFTHWDTYLKSFINHPREGNRFRQRSKVNWEEVYQKASDGQEKVIERFQTALSLNTSKKKPRIVGKYRAALLQDSENMMENTLEAHHIDYGDAIHALLSDLTAQIAAKGGKYRVTEGIEQKVKVDGISVKPQSIQALYTNLVECKDLKLYASTVRACIRKWRDSGDIHKSSVVANEYGFQNINTFFVQEIRNYAMFYVKKVQVQLDQFLPNEDDRLEFQAELLDYLTVRQNVGREVAKALAREAYKKGFEKAEGFRYQYERFGDMLQYLQDMYFMSPAVSFTPQFEACFVEAVKTCISIFIDTKCIMVY